jgi:hypothetical protein
MTIIITVEGQKVEIQIRQLLLFCVFGVVTTVEHAGRTW